MVALFFVVLPSLPLRFNFVLTAIVTVVNLTMHTQGGNLTSIQLQGKWNNQAKCNPGVNDWDRTLSRLLKEQL